jgi:rubrerythrin
MIYECQICGYTVSGRPDEWCPVCGGHRAIFKRITNEDQELFMAS